MRKSSSFSQPTELGISSRGFFYPFNFFSSVFPLLRMWTPSPPQPFKYLDNDNANQMPLTASTNGCRGILHDSTDNPPDKAYGYRIPLPFRPFDRQNRWTLIFFFRSYPKRKGNGESTWISSVITKNYENATAQVLEGCDGFLPKKRVWYTAAARGRIFNPFFFFLPFFLQLRTSSFIFDEGRGSH